MTQHLVLVVVTMNSYYLIITVNILMLKYNSFSQDFLLFFFFLFPFFFFPSCIPLLSTYPDLLSKADVVASLHSHISELREMRC